MPPSMAARKSPRSNARAIPVLVLCSCKIPRHKPLIALSTPRGFLLPNVAVTTLLPRDGGWRVGTLNDVAHARPAWRDPTFPFD